MALTNQERVGKAMDLLKQGLAPFVERELTNAHGDRARAEALKLVGEEPNVAKRPLADWDVAALLKVMRGAWNDVFGRVLGRAERTLVQELGDWRNDWAHQKALSSDDADRALDSMARLLTAISAPQADEVGKMKLELRRLVYDEQVRSEKRKAGASLIDVAAGGTLKPWREVVTPHADVASGGYQQAEFAADLWQVHLGEGTPEYRDPTEFFRRTYLTESLRALLVNGIRRIYGKGGDPVVQLQTNFGGGKTHSMLALYHLFSGVSAKSLPGVEAILAEAGVKGVPAAKRVVLVGNKISPGNPVTKPDGTVVRTLWGELAWQLGGKKAFAKVKADDEKATSPGDALRELFKEYGPCLVLIDEWVAYARQLHDQRDLPAGTFETQFSFAQVLTESAKLAKNCLLVISLPASDTTGSPHTQTDDVEVGGIRGREALDRLRNVVGRLEASWRPATSDEGFEIVRRRLFEPLEGPASFTQRDLTARAFGDTYRAQSAEFPPECRTADYEKRIQAAYPIHPEIFDRLYADWSTLAKFQRTRGVLRLMAAVIHSLWEKGDKNPLILPSMIPIDDGRVRDELTRYLSDNWVPILEKDVDGPGSLPLKLDGDVPNLGKLHATRRVARTIYLGSAPTTSAAHRGLEDRRVKLGCVMPGEPPAVFGDALRRLAAAATYLYQDGPRAWYSTQPTVTKLAEDRAEQLKRDPDKVAQELEDRLRADLRKTGDFTRIHPLPRSGADVPDDLETRLVVLSAEDPYGKEPSSPAEVAAKAILASRGSAPRLYQNTLVFLAADRVRFEDLDEALRKFLAWESIVADTNTLNLDPHQVRQAETQKQAADGAVTARLPETYQWLLAPGQANPQAPVKWEATRLTGTDALAVRASKKLKSDEWLVTTLGSTVLRKHLDDVPLWRGDRVAIRQLVDDFARYLYLPRLLGPEVLAHAVTDGVRLLTWQVDTFAYAESFDEAGPRYRGLKCGQVVAVSPESTGLLVKADVARKQIDEETQAAAAAAAAGAGSASAPGAVAGGVSGRASSSAPGASPVPATVPAGPIPPRRYHGTVRLDPARAGRDASRIADEVIAHFAGLEGADVTVTLEIEATIPDGASEQLVRTVTENGRTLKFESFGFEEE
ncbi:MAG TPA: Swt1 family HEPN domain-containing protein [Thermoanaerobaculia bacterium]|jgi:predicted AAA+ superfamily ATPase|nr:Swt1 family HEPN domain-containing protein [Thermoanaerobaculia bacterium]HQN06610.1 Swt1 family HEPN domain-containing protein [Thermoanaerobaculia bacterium]HQP84868.1 Swt1 family HEPN domain-containing protein [Thermoanaerobaculia bacterium]